jgi:glycosyltransferase involved in cell wall biosynthesis
VSEDSAWAPTVSVIVAARNAEATIADCVRSLLRLEYDHTRLELIVVDNASTDRTCARLAEFGDRIRLLHESRRGASAARNTGIVNATGECIAFTDADCVVEPDWLRHLIPTLEDPTVGVAGGDIRALRPCNRIELFAERLHDHRAAIEEFDPPYAITMNWASRRGVLEEADLFDEALLRGQDVDLAFRIRAAGYRLVYCREALIFHRNPSTLRALFARGRLHGRANVAVLGKAAPLGLARARKWLRTERRILRHAGRLLTGPDRFDQLCQIVLDLGKVYGETESVIGRLRAEQVVTWVLAATAAIFAGLYLASIGPYWHISPDSATYVGWAQALAAGQGWNSPPTTPPVVSLVFAAALALVPGGYVALNAVTRLLILGGCGIAYLLIQRRAGRVVAMLVVVLTLASTHVLQESAQLLSEPAYLFFSMAALLMLDEPAAGEEQGRPVRRRAWAAGVLLPVVVLTRYVGMALPVAVLLVEGHARVTRRRAPRLPLVALALLALAAGFLWGLESRPDTAGGWYQTFLLVDPWMPSAGRLGLTGLLGRIRENLAWLPAAGGMLLNSWSPGLPALSFFLHTAGLLLVGSGLYRSVQRRVTVEATYVTLYLVVIAGHMLVGGHRGYRFLIPVAPLVFYYAIVGLTPVARYAARGPNRRAALSLGTIGALYLVGYVGQGLRAARAELREAHASPFGDYPIKRPSNYDAERVALRLKAISRPEERYAAGMRDMFDVLSERRGEDLVPARTSPAEEFVGWLDQREIRYLLVDRTQTPLADSLMAVVRAHPGVFRTVEELPRAGLYEVIPPQHR